MAGADEAYLKVVGWADKYKRMGVLANAETPADVAKAVEMGAEGVGLCRTEHMFFSPRRLDLMRAMILADDEDQRRKARPQPPPAFPSASAPLTTCRVPVVSCRVLSCPCRVPAGAGAGRDAAAAARGLPGDLQAVRRQTGAPSPPPAPLIAVPRLTAHRPHDSFRSGAGGQPVSRALSELFPLPDPRLPTARRASAVEMYHPPLLSKRRWAADGPASTKWLRALPIRRMCNVTTAGLLSGPLVGHQRFFVRWLGETPGQCAVTTACPAVERSAQAGVHTNRELRPTPRPP